MVLIRSCIQNDNKAARRERRKAYYDSMLKESVTKPTLVTFEGDFV
ncbi:hypothetical protein KJ640_01710 [bacterium]|nr:hypothetical protein [bacterium]